MDGSLALLDPHRVLRVAERVLYVGVGDHDDEVAVVQWHQPLGMIPVETGHAMLEGHIFLKSHK